MFGLEWSIANCNVCIGHARGAASQRLSGRIRLAATSLVYHSAGWATNLKSRVGVGRADYSPFPDSIAWRAYIFFAVSGAIPGPSRRAG